MRLSLPHTAGKALFTAEAWAAIHDENGNRVLLNYTDKAYRPGDITIPYEHEMTITASTQEHVDQPTNSIVPQRELTSSENLDLFGEDEDGSTLPDQQLNAILDATYTKLDSEKHPGTQRPASQAKVRKESTKTSKEVAAKVNDVSKPFKKKTKSTEAASTSSHSNTKKKAEHVSKSSERNSQGEKNDKEVTQDSKPKKPYKLSTKPRGVWSSILAMCQQLKLYAGVKKNEYYSFDAIRPVVNEFELNDPTIEARILRHGDGWLELIVSGVLDDRSAYKGTRQSDPRDTSVLEMSRRAMFHSDVVIKEYTGDDALDAIGDVSPEFDAGRMIAIFYEHPDGRVEYLISGPVWPPQEVVHSDNEEDEAKQSTTSDLAGENEPSESDKKPADPIELTARDGLLVLVDENDTPIANNETPREMSSNAAPSTSTTGMRKRAASNDEDLSAEQTAPKVKKARNEQGTETTAQTTGRPKITLKNSKRDAAPSHPSTEAPTPKGKRKRNADDDENGEDTPTNKKARSEPQGQAKPKSLIVVLKISNKDASAAITSQPAQGVVDGEQSSEENEDANDASTVEKVRKEQSLSANKGRCIVSLNVSNRAALAAVISQPAPPAKGKRGRQDDDEGSDDDVPLIKRVRKNQDGSVAGPAPRAIKPLKAAKKPKQPQWRASRANASDKDTGNDGAAEPNKAPTAPSATMTGEDAELVTEEPNTAPAALGASKSIPGGIIKEVAEESNTDPATTTASTLLDATQADGEPNTAPTAPKQQASASTPLEDASEVVEEPITAPTASSTSPASTQNDVKSVTGAASNDGGKPHIKKATGTARNKREHATAGTDPDRMPSVKQVKKRGRDEDRENDDPSGGVEKGLKQA